MLLRRIDFWLGLIASIIAIGGLVVSFLYDEIVQGLIFSTLLLFLASLVFYVTKNGFRFPSVLRIHTTSVDQALVELKDLYHDVKVEALRDLADRLPDNLSGAEAQALLIDLYFDDRVEAIHILVPKLKHKLSAAETEMIIGDLYHEYRRKAIRYLSGYDD